MTHKGEGDSDGRQGTEFRTIGPIVRGRSTREATKRQARAFRTAPTASEAAAWELLRDRRLDGLKFRRQQPIRGFVVDFYCAELGLVIELDGGVHAEPAVAARDADRTRVLTSLGLRVVRVPNEALSTEALRQAIKAADFSERRDARRLPP